MLCSQQVAVVEKRCGVVSTGIIDWSSAGHDLAGRDVFAQPIQIFPRQQRSLGATAGATDVVNNNRGAIVPRFQCVLSILLPVYVIAIRRS